jgi:ABC-type Fe3+ transport system substrate-binding protein
VGAAVGARARHTAAAAFVQFLGSERGQQAFAACVPGQ